MVPVIEAKKEELFALCRKYNVRKLELFGSAARGAFDPESSDLDFLVVLDSQEPVRHSDDYFGLLFAFEKLFGCKLDLVETEAIENPYFFKIVGRDRTVLYAA
jgi:predicted nucleotidyltransferase